MVAVEVEAAIECGVGRIFDALAGEIELAAARCIFLDSVIGEVMPSLPPEAQQRLREGLQAVDLLSQHLTGLSAFSRQLGLDTPDDVGAPVVNALAQVTLGALADRLGGAMGREEQGVDDRHDAGELDLF